MADTQAPDLSAVFANLAIEPSSEPLPEPTRGTAGGPNPFTDAVKASVEHGTPYSINVPDGAVKRAIFLINAAAKKQNLGVRIVVNVKRDKQGHVVKDKQGKAQNIVDEKGNVLVRFQGLKERKQQTAPRPYSIVDVKGEPGVKGVRRRSDKALLFKGTPDEAKAKYEELKTQYMNTPIEQRHDYVAPAQTPADTTQQGNAEQVTADEQAQQAAADAAQSTA